MLCLLGCVNDGTNFHVECMEAINVTFTTTFYSWDRDDPIVN